MPCGSPDWFLNKLHRRLGLPRLPDWLGNTVIVLIGCGILAGAWLFAGRREDSGEGHQVAQGLLAADRSAPSSRGGGIVVLYFVLTIALISLTPWPQQFWRYLAPLAPLSALFLVHAVRVLARGIARRWGSQASTAGALFAGALLAVLLGVQLLVARMFLHTLLPVSYYDASGNELPRRLLTYGHEWHALDPALEWLRQHTGPSDVIATTVPHLAYLRSGRRAVLPPMEPDPELARRLLVDVPVKYLLLDELGRPGISERYAAPVVERSPDEWKLVYATPGGGARVHERVR